MNIEHLSYILEVFYCGSVNKAAKKCYISQSNLSSIIKGTEAEIGYPLFFRNSSGITPTPEGKLFMSHAEKIIIEKKNIENIPQSFSKSSNLSILCARSSFVLQCFLDFQKRYPCENSQDIFLEAGLKENIKNIIAQRCRISILVMFESLIPKYQNIAAHYNLNFTIMKKRIPMMVLMNKKHDLADKATLEMSDLHQYPFVADAHIDYEDTLKILGIGDKQNVLYACDRGTVFDAVRKGNYISIGIKITPSDAEIMGCINRTVSNGKTMAICLLKTQNLAYNSRENQFLKYLQECIDKYY